VIQERVIAQPELQDRAPGDAHPAPKYRTFTYLFPASAGRMDAFSYPVARVRHAWDDLVARSLKIE
jgi:hypothetical protein